MASMDGAVPHPEAIKEESKMIKMSVSKRIVMACQLDALAGHYGLTELYGHKRGYWFIGPESAWRKLADDIDYRSNGFWSDGRTYASDGLHGRITKAAAKQGVAA
jgi:hypothetical protein